MRRGLISLIVLAALGLTAATASASFHAGTGRLTVPHALDAVAGPRSLRAARPGAGLHLRTGLNGRCATENLQHYTAHLKSSK
jgi:hypothetical protein